MRNEKVEVGDEIYKMKSMMRRRRVILGFLVAVVRDGPLSEYGLLAQEAHVTLNMRNYSIIHPTFFKNYIFNFMVWFPLKIPNFIFLTKTFI